MTDMRAELEKLSSEAIATIHQALHELLCGDLKQLALDILWDRHATPGGLWPLRFATVGNQNDRRMTVDRPEHELVGYCAAGKMPSSPTVHHDDEHTVVRTLELTVPGYPAFGGIECSCGRRTDRTFTSGMKLEIKWYRLRPDASVWPKVSDRARNDGLPCFQVCQDAPSADHQGHAPNSIGERCLCGTRLGAYHGVCKDKFLSVQ